MSAIPEFSRTPRLIPEKAVFRPALALRLLPGSNGTNMVSAIETEYHGHRFRSRLEARWAVFFTYLGIEWQYEPEGFEAPGGRYLPDFYLPDHKVWCEVKGAKGGLYEDRSKLVAVLQDGGPLPLLILGNVPACKSDIPIHACLIRHDVFGLCRVPALFLALNDEVRIGITDVISEPGSRMESMHAAAGWFAFTQLDRDDLPDREDAWDPEYPGFTPIPRHFPRLAAAYQAARTARFEHGERG